MTTPEAAQADAAAAQADLSNAERQLAEGRTVSFDRLHALADRARHTSLAARGEQTRAERKRAEQRTADLGDLGEEIDALAVSPNLAEMRQAVRDVADACARVHRLADNHDAAVAALAQTAEALSVEPPSPSGPRESSGHIAVKRQGSAVSITHRRNRVQQVAGQILAVLGQAQDGNADGALALLQAVDSTRPAWRPKVIARGPNGVLIAMDNISDPMAAQIASGELSALSEHEIDLWMEGAIS